MAKASERDIARAVMRRYRATAVEPRDRWSRANLVRDHGVAPLTVVIEEFLAPRRRQLETKPPVGAFVSGVSAKQETRMNTIIYVVGLVVVVGFILSFLGMV